MTAFHSYRHPGLVPGSIGPHTQRLWLVRHDGPRNKSGVTMVAVLSLFLAVPALADSGLPPAALANTQLRDPALEAKAQALMVTLRCVVCQGQSIADSDADLAGDMRAMVRQRILAGESPASIRRWMVERYGDYVSYDPPFSAVTAPLWIAPVLLLAIGGWLARGSFKRRRRG